MSQLTIYLDEEALRSVRTAARRERMSVSRWARLKLTVAASRSWPADYFDLFGALSESDMERPSQGEVSLDLERNTL